MKPQQIIVAMLVALLLGATVDPARGEGEGAKRPDRVLRDVGPDLIAVGSTLLISQPVAGDLFAAAGTLDVHGEVGGDALLAGGTVSVNAAVKNGVYAAGGRVAINAPVQRNVRIAGGSIEIGTQAKIAGNVAIAGGDVTVHGPIDGYLRVGAGRVLINAAIGGDVEAGTGSLELGPNARITGKLRYASSAPLYRDAAARTDGGVDRIEPVQPSLPSPMAHGERGGASWLWTGGLALLAAALALALPHWYARVADTLQSRPGMSALVGFIVLACVPVAAVLLLVTIVGVPLALGVLLLYPLLLLVGYASTAVALGRMALARWMPERLPRAVWRALAAALAMIVIGAAARVPWLGAIVIFVVLVVGVGSFVMPLRHGAAASA